GLLLRPPRPTSAARHTPSHSGHPGKGLGERARRAGLIDVEAGQAVAASVLTAWLVLTAGTAAVCQRVFSQENDLRLLDMVLDARADLEDQLGHRAEVVGLEERALRYLYLVGDMAAIAVSTSTSPSTWYVRDAVRTPCRTAWPPP